MRALIVQLFGSYYPQQNTIYERVWNPITEEFETFVNTVTAEGLASWDWEWIAGVGLFALTLWCVMRIIGGVICGRF